MNEDDRSTTHLKHITVLNVRVDDVTFDQVLSCIDSYIADQSIHQIATVNVEFIIEARRNAAFRQVLAKASVCVPDGIGVLWAARRQGFSLRERVAGVDLVDRIAARAAKRGWRIFFLGARPGVAERAAVELTQRYPELKVAGCYAGSPSVEHEDEIIRWVRAADPDVLFVAYGAPRQDLWIARNQTKIGVPVALGVGGAFDFISGDAQRAPVWMQRVGLEWLHRLLREPWRLRRQMAIPQFIWLVLTGRD